MRFPISIQYYKGSYGATVLDLPGCVAIGDTINEVRKLIRKAIAMHIDLMRQHGEQIPNPSKVVKIKLGELEDQEFITWVDVADNLGQRKDAKGRAKNLTK